MKRNLPLIIGILVIVGAFLLAARPLPKGHKAAPRVEPRTVDETIVTEPARKPRPLMVDFVTKPPATRKVKVPSQKEKDAFRAKMSARFAHENAQLQVMYERTAARNTLAFRKVTPIQTRQKAFHEAQRISHQSHMRRSVANGHMVHPPSDMKPSDK